MPPQHTLPLPSKPECSLDHTWLMKLVAFFSLVSWDTDDTGLSQTQATQTHTELEWQCDASQYSTSGKTTISWMTLWHSRSWWHFFSTPLLVAIPALGRLLGSQACYLALQPTEISRQPQAICPHPPQTLPKHSLIISLPLILPLIADHRPHCAECWSHDVDPGPLPTHDTIFPPLV